MKEIKGVEFPNNKNKCNLKCLKYFFPFNYNESNEEIKNNNISRKLFVFFIILFILNILNIFLISILKDQVNNSITEKVYKKDNIFFDKEKSKSKRNLDFDNLLEEKFLKIDKYDDDVSYYSLNELIYLGKILIEGFLNITKSYKTPIFKKINFFRNLLDSNTTSKNSSEEKMLNFPFNNSKINDFLYNQIEKIRLIMFCSILIFSMKLITIHLVISKI